MRNNFFRIASVIILLIMVLSGSVCAENSYYYDNAEKSHEAPMAYEWKSSVALGTNQIPDIGKISDIHTDKMGNIYLLSSDNGKIAVLDNSMNYLKTVILKKNGLEENCAGASGMFLAEYGSEMQIYIADPNNQRILWADLNGNIKRVYNRPDTELISEETQFAPLKITVNESGCIIAICRGVYSGAVVMNENGEFLGFYGSNKINLTLSVVYDSFWKKIFGSSRSGTMSRYVPIEFTNLAINEKGFIYTATASETDNSGLRLLNFNSENIFPEEGMGDLETITSQGTELNSAFSDLAYVGGGVLAALDTARNRVFLYNEEGEMLTVFGGNGSSKGYFGNPTAVASHKTTIYVYDEAVKTVSAFVPNSYGDNLLNATAMYMQGNYDKARACWEEVLKQNNGFNTAYISIGRSLMSMNDYKGAMEYFELGESKIDYSQAFSEQRKVVLKKWFLPIFIFLIASVSALFYFLSDKRMLKKAKTKKQGNGIAYAVFHPSKGIMAAVNSEIAAYKLLFPIVLISWFIVNIFSSQYSGFIFNTLNTNPLDLRVEFIATVAAGLMFVASNWLIVTMTEGTGTVRQISRVVAIALIPYLCGRLITTLLSNVLLLEEAAIVNAPVVLCIIWAAAILLIGLSKIHDFKASQAVLNLLFTVFGMAVVAFLLLLEISIIKQIQMLLVTVFDELVMLLQ